jgi:HEAT repeat protein
VGLFNLDEFPHYTLESFDDKQVATFIDHWYDSRLKEDPAQADRRKADLQKAFARNERIRLLAKNPLLLTIITLIHRYQAELPRRRCNLYEIAVRTLLMNWDSGKEINLYEDVLKFLKQDDLLYILKKLAYWIHTQGSTGETEGGTLIDKDELIRWLRKEIQTLKKCEAHEAKGEAERFIDFIQRRTGLLNEQGRDRYAFVHKTFQEYLTAEEIFDRADVEDDTEIILDHFRQHLHDQHWREVLLLLVSKLKGKKAQKAIQAVLDAGSEYEQWLHRDLLFAGWCLTEDPPELSVVAADWVGEILDRLLSLEVGNSKQIGRIARREAGKILLCFGETTTEQIVWNKLQKREDRIKPRRLLEFQVSLRQESNEIETLLFSLRDQQSFVRSRAARKLGQLCNVSPEAISCLISLQEDRDSYVRSSVAKALGQLDNNNPEVVSGLLFLLRDENSNVRSHAVASLGQLGNASPEVVSGLLSLREDRSPSVRSSATTVLGQLGNASPEVVSGLLSLLYSEKSNVRANAVSALGQVGNNPEVVSELLFLLKDRVSYVRSSAVTVLGRLGINASLDVVNGLIALLCDENSDVRSRAASALGYVDRTNLEVVNSLLSLLTDESSTVRYRAATALGRLENGIPAVVIGLQSLLDDESSTVRCRAAMALGRLKNASPEVVSSLISLLGDKQSDVSYRAADALSRLYKTSDTIFPKVLQWLKQNPNDDGIGSAIDCLWSIVVE